MDALAPRVFSMNRKIRSLLASGALLVGAAVSASACSDNNSSLLIAGVMYAKAPDCTVSGDPTQPMLGGGTLDLAFRSNYRAWLLVGNQLTPRGQKENLKTETTRVTLNGAEITLTDSQGNAIAGVGKFSVFGTGFVNTSKSEEPAWGLFSTTLIPDTVGAALTKEIGTSRTTKKQVIVNVKVFGQTTGNISVESGPLSFPINVCYGCLISYPQADISITTGECQAPNNVVEVALACNIGQDDPIPCSVCATTIDACKKVQP
jgi:hypothetical protein